MMATNIKNLEELNALDVTIAPGDYICAYFQDDDMRKRGIPPSFLSGEVYRFGGGVDTLCCGPVEVETLEDFAIVEHTPFKKKIDLSDACLIEYDGGVFALMSSDESPYERTFVSLGSTDEWDVVSNIEQSEGVQILRKLSDWYDEVEK